LARRDSPVNKIGLLRDVSQQAFLFFGSLVRHAAMRARGDLTVKEADLAKDADEDA
jgi:hypothetical protein